MTCITPRAFADETAALLNPLSCQAIAVASEGETPYWEAIDWTSPAPTRVLVGTGSAAGTTGAGPGCAARGGKRGDRGPARCGAGSEAVPGLNGGPARRRGGRGRGRCGRGRGRGRWGGGRGRRHEARLLQRRVALG